MLLAFCCQTKIRLLTKADFVWLPLLGSNYERYALAANHDYASLRSAKHNAQTVRANKEK